MCKESKVSGYQALYLPSVGFAATFDRAANTTGNKVYRFSDLKDRDLILSPDSTAGIFRWYLDECLDLNGIKCSWVAPCFRYRNVQHRGFHQFGFAAINTLHCPNGNLDWPLIEVTNSLLKIFKNDLGLDISIEVTNIGGIRRLLVDAAKSGESGALLGQLYSIKSKDERSRYLRRYCKQNPAHEALEFLFGQTDRSTISHEAEELLEALTNEMQTFADHIIEISGIGYCLQTLHSSEILSGLGVRFFTASGTFVGDGGRYDVYGQAFDDRIKSVVSTCSGVEMISRETEQLSNQQSCILISTADYAHVAYWLAESLRDANFSASIEIIAETKHQRRATKSIAQKSLYFGVIGSQEVNDEALWMVTSGSKNKSLVRFSELASWLNQRDSEAKKRNHSYDL